MKKNLLLWIGYFSFVNIVEVFLLLMAIVSFKTNLVKTILLLVFALILFIWSNKLERELSKEVLRE